MSDKSVPKSDMAAAGVGWLLILANEAKERGALNDEEHARVVELHCALFEEHERLRFLAMHVASLIDAGAPLVGAELAELLNDSHPEILTAAREAREHAESESDG